MKEEYEVLGAASKEFNETEEYYSQVFMDVIKRRMTRLWRRQPWIKMPVTFCRWKWIAPAEAEIEFAKRNKLVKQEQ